MAPQASTKSSDIQQSGFITSIHRLPVELLNEVFLCALYSEPLTSRSVSASSPLWCFALVCRRWRHVLLFTPLKRIWSWVCIDASGCPETHDGGKTTVPVLKMWLERSGDLPLDVIVKQICDPHEYDVDDEALQLRTDLCSLVAEEASRWKTLQIYIQAYSYLDLSQRAPLLEYFFCYHTDAMHYMDSDAVSEGPFEDEYDLSGLQAPALRELRLNIAHAPDHWPTLTSCFLGNGYPESYLRLKAMYLSLI